MEPEEVTVENWVEKLEELLGLDHYDPLSSSMREHLSIEGQSAIRALKDRLPISVRTVRQV